MSPTSKLPIAEEAPSGENLTDYDRAQLPVYLRLLDAAAENAPWEKVSRIVLGLDPAVEPTRAKRAYDTHLSRAQWLTQRGFREILKGGG